ncbi:hypothetical protein WA556_004104 [Blastocystis sp. ATCC 50177/Nand II]
MTPVVSPSRRSRRSKSSNVKVVNQPQFTVVNQVAKPRRRNHANLNTSFVLQNTLALKKSRGASRGNDSRGNKAAQNGNKAAQNGNQSNRNNGRRSRRQNGKKNNRLTPEQLDKQLDNYWARDEDVMKQKLDSELESYYANNTAAAPAQQPDPVPQAPQPEVNPGETTTGQN